MCHKGITVATNGSRTRKSNAMIGPHPSSAAMDSVTMTLSIALRKRVKKETIG